MKIKKKLRDLTREEYVLWKETECNKIRCIECLFDDYGCNAHSGWIAHKDMYSDKFLNQEIEVECDILTEDEKKYLKAVIEPYKDRIHFIQKNFFTCGYSYIYIEIDVQAIVPDYVFDNITLPVFEDSKMYKGMEQGKQYILEELGL